MKWNNVLMLCGALVAAGCGSDTGGRIAVSGSVTYDGEPLPAGRILFTPAEDKPGPSAGEPIDDGHFTILAEEGPATGRYEVTVTTGAMPQKNMMIGSNPASQTPLVQESQTFRFTRTSADLPKFGGKGGYV